MNNDPISRIYVDHYLQVALLSRLSNADRPLRFSELKEDGIENSLFMYHANKLIARKAVTKDNDGFRLTSSGARWINSVSRDMMKIQPTVKLLVQFVVRDTSGNILLSTRKGQLKELLNDYMLPGGLHKNGVSADENAVRVSKTIFSKEQFEPQFLSVVESINSYSDGFIYHSLSHVYAIDVTPEVSTTEDERFSFEWMPISDIHASNSLFAKSQYVPLLLEKLQNDTLRPREVMRINYNV